MQINSGFKIVDKLVSIHGIAFHSTNNPFQLTVELPAETSLYELRYLLQPFGLHNFPSSMWLSLCKQVPCPYSMSLHRFTLPHTHQVLCWLLIDHSGHIIEQAIPYKKVKYKQATNRLTQFLRKPKPLVPLFN